MLALNIAHFPKNLASERNRAFGTSPEARPLFCWSTLRNKRLTALQTLHVFLVHTALIFGRYAGATVRTNAVERGANFLKIPHAEDLNPPFL
jgi:hypothetical protein